MSHQRTIYEFLQNEIGPVEIEEKNGIFWNRLDWPSYIKCPFNTDLSNLIRIVQDGWCIDPPQIILSILSDFQALNKWQNMEQIKKFQAGLVKSASSAQTWIITNGLNTGASRITSEAIVNERNWQHSLINMNETTNSLEFSDWKQINAFYSKYSANSNLFQQLSEQEQFKFGAMMFDTLNGHENEETKLSKKPIINAHLQKLNISRNTQFAFNLPIMKSVIIGVIDSNQIVSGPFLYKRLDNIDQPRLDVLSSIKYARQYDMKLTNLTDSSDSNAKRSKEQYRIDQNHSHFIFVQKTPEESQEDEQLLALELFYEISYLGSWIMSKQVAKPSNLQQRITLQKYKNSRIPFTAILMQGDFKTANLCSKYLLKQIPILILQGTGGFADLLSYAYLELIAYLVEQNNIKPNQHLLFPKTHHYSKYSTVSPQSSSSNLNSLYTNRSNIPNEYLDRVLKPTLTRRIKQSFPKESKDTKEFVEQFTDKILECVLHANQEGIEYVTILDVNRTETKLEFLNEYLLHNYLKCRQTNQSEHADRPEDDLKMNLRLTIEWNNCKTAKQLLERYLKTDYFTIDKSLFLHALVKKDRESFIELFLEFGFKLRSIFTFDTLTWLMQKSSKNHLFLLICCQNILGLPFKERFPSDHEFINALNTLIFMTCKLRNFINLNELTNRYNCEPNCLEQKAVIFFTLWSVFNFKDELTKKLWPFSSYPIHLLLMISKTLITISKYSYDLAIRKQIDEQIEFFNCKVIELLDVCQSKSDANAIKTISDEIEHWNNFIAIDIAASIKHHNLIAHQSAQKWLDYKLMNGIHLKHSGLGQFVNSIKVFLSVVFVFPILFWLDYPHHALFDQYLDIPLEKKASFNQASDQKFDTNKLNPKKKKEISGFFKNTWLVHNLSRPFNKSVDGEILLTDINLKDKWLLLVDSPMSKYVIHFLNFLIFLVFFSYVVIRPDCGDQTLDSILFVYLFVYYIEMIRKDIIKYRSFMYTNYQWEFSEFVLYTFLLFYFFHDRLNPFNTEPHSYYGRMSMLTLLFLAYLKLLSVFMPMFNTLAPLSYRIRMMSLHDIKMFIGLVWPFMVAFGTIIEVSLYPDRWLFVNRLITQSFLHRTIVTLFRTPYHEVLEQNDHCDSQHLSPAFHNSTHCQIGDYNNSHCNNRGFFAHLYLFAYIFILKLVMLTLLHALFNASMLSVEMNTIWRYQRFFLITDFSLDYPLPAPFCVVFYLIDSINFLISKFTFQKKQIKDENLLINSKEEPSDESPATCNCSNESIAFFWRTISRELVKK